MAVNIDGAPAHRSYSSFTSWLSCGKQWQLQRIAKVPEVPAWYLVGGNAVHEATEQYDRLWWDTKDEGFDATRAFNEAFDRLATKQLEDTGVPFDQWRAGGRRSKAWPNKEDAEWWLQSGPVQVQKYIEWRIQVGRLGWNLWSINDVPAIELELLAMFGNVPLKMYIDRVMVSPHGELVVVDLKSGSRTPDNALQLGVYASGMELTLGTRPAYGAYYMTRDAALTDAYPLTGFTVQSLSTELEMFNRAVDAQIFIPHRTSLCNSCGVRDACAAVGGAKAHLYDPLHPDFERKTA